MQNTSHAVMAQRVEAHDSLDDFPTPPWAVRAMCEWLKPDPASSVWEPAANRGFLAEGLRDHFATVYGSDVHDYGVGFPVHDFLMPGTTPFSPDWIITNPPFRLAQQFVERALDVASCGVAVIVRSVWAEGVGRFETLFCDRPPTAILQHVERVPMVKGRYDPGASTATSYSWFIWDRRSVGKGTQFGWIPPSRTRLFRETDTHPQGGLPPKA